MECRKDRILPLALSPGYVRLLDSKFQNSNPNKILDFKIHLFRWFLKSAIYMAEGIVMHNPRNSDCSELTTEDNRTSIQDGQRLYNYYDGKWGIVEFIPGRFGTSYDGWFMLRHEDGTSTLLNGVRVSTTDRKVL
jgi:hypothetical protein